MPRNPLIFGCVVRPEGLEPPAYWFEANRSIQLSYGRQEFDTNPNTAAERSLSQNPNRRRFVSNDF